jgi:hypothetical protein
MELILIMTGLFTCMLFISEYKYTTIMRITSKKYYKLKHESQKLRVEKINLEIALNKVEEDRKILLDYFMLANGIVDEKGRLIVYDCDLTSCFKEDEILIYDGYMNNDINSFIPNDKKILEVIKEHLKRNKLWN